MKIVFDEQAWEDYLYWQETDRKLAAKRNTLIRDCARSPFSGLGKPEPHRGRLSGWWS
jgi:toxin YoeB